MYLMGDAVKHKSIRQASLPVLRMWDERPLRCGTVIWALLRNDLGSTQVRRAWDEWNIILGLTAM